MSITQAELFGYLEYNPNTGEFTWRVANNRHTVIGSIAGSLHTCGYVYIKINKVQYVAQRLAWIYVHGDIPPGMKLDHMNGDRADNRICNLRCVTHTTNLQNQQKAQLGNTSGYLGVSWSNGHNKWHAQIQVGGRNRHLGYFATPEGAHKEYLKAKRTMHEGCLL